MTEINNYRGVVRDPLQDSASLTSIAELIVRYTCFAAIYDDRNDVLESNDNILDI